MQLAGRRPLSRRFGIVVGIALAVGLVLVGLLTPTGGTQLGSVQTAQSPLLIILTWALPTFVAGVFSFLSPCTLPILPAYFAFTFQAKRHQIALMTLAFFFGLATTMTLLGAVFSLLGRAVYNLRDHLTFWGGIIIIAFGLMSLLGKGFSGPALQRRPSTTFLGTYVYGMTFALGWSACVGPILGGLLTLLAAQGATVLAGASLALIYTCGLALPLFVVAVFFNRLGTGSRAWSLLRGRGFSVDLFGRTLHLHTTSVLSGVLLIIVGYLLASGQLAVFSQQAASTRMGEWALQIEQAISSLFGLGQ